MDQESIDQSFELDDSPSTIRAAMASTRQQLALHLSALKERLLHPLTPTDPVKEPNMPAKKTKGRQPAEKKSENEKAPSSRADAKVKTKPPQGVREERSEKTAKPKADRSSKSAGTKTRKTSRTGKAATSPKKTSGHKSEVQGLVAMTGETLDTMVAGAIVVQ